jgi:hypothetical protein
VGQDRQGCGGQGRLKFDPGAPGCRLVRARYGHTLRFYIRSLCKVCASRYAKAPLGATHRWRALLGLQNRGRTGRGFAPRPSALLTVGNAVFEPDSLPRQIVLGRPSPSGRYRMAGGGAAGQGTAPLRAVAVAPGVADPPKGGCVGPRALRSCTTPDSPCPARANQRSPDRAGALRWRRCPNCACAYAPPRHGVKAAARSAA